MSDNNPNIKQQQKGTGISFVPGKDQVTRLNEFFGEFNAPVSRIPIYGEIGVESSIRNIPLLPVKTNNT